MAVKESDKILDEMHELDKNIHFYKTELLLERPAEYIVEVRKLLAKTEERKRVLGFRLSEAKHKEDIAEKNSIKK